MILHIHNTCVLNEAVHMSEFLLLLPKTRVELLVANLTNDEKSVLFVNGAGNISRIGWPAYQWWSEVPLLRLLLSRFVTAFSFTFTLNLMCSLQGSPRRGA